MHAKRATPSDPNEAEQLRVVKPQVACLKELLKEKDKYNTLQAANIQELEHKAAEFNRKVDEFEQKADALATPTVATSPCDKELIEYNTVIGRILY